MSGELFLVVWLSMTRWHSFTYGSKCESVVKTEVFYTEDKAKQFSKSVDGDLFKISKNTTTLELVTTPIYTKSHWKK